MPDRLTLARAFEEAGIKLASELYDAIHDNVATRSDLLQLRTELGARIDLAEHRLITRLGGMIVVAAGILIAIKYFGGVRARQRPPPPSDGA